MALPTCKHFTLYAALLFFAMPVTVMAQQFGGNPPSIKWKQVNTPAAKVIFPDGMDSTALRVSSIIEQVDRKVQPTIGNKQKQVSIVLQNQTTESNGYVGLAPFRSEFFLTPQQNSFELGSIPWPELLSMHEYRHVQQYNNFNVGLTRVLSTIFGQGGQAFGNELSIHNWLFEGDAVFNETLVSRQGRGRLPYFYKDYRSLWAAGKNYSWMKLRSGSYVDLVPNHYPMGYMLVAYGREKYGDDFWKKVTHDAASFKGLVYSLQRAIKKYAGVSYDQFRTDALNYFRQRFDDKAPAGMDPKSHFIANEEFPAFVDDSTMVYLKSPYNKIPAFTIKSGITERKIATRGLVQDNFFSYHNGKIIYSGYRPDKRWGYRNYNELRIIDVNTGSENRITKNTKYFSPAFNGDGSRIVTVQVTPDGKSELHVLTADGKLLSSVNNPDGLFYTHPKFYNDSTLIAAARNSKGEMALVQVSIESSVHEYLLPFSYQLIGFVSLQGDTVYFTATSGQNDRLFAWDMKQGKLYELNSEELKNSIGNYQPTASAKKLAFTGATAFGMRINQVDKASVSWNSIAKNQLPGSLVNFEVNVLDNNKATNLLARVTDSAYSIKPYSKAYNLFNFHSLIPDFDDPNYRFSLMGENVLNTFQSELFFNYNRNEGYKQAGFAFTYGALYPYLSIGADYVYERRRFYRGNTVYWNEVNLHAGWRIPFNFSSGKWIRGLSFGSDVYYTQTNYDAAFSTLDRNFTYLNNSLTYSSRVQQARQHINPRFGHSYTLIYKAGISTSASQWMASGTFYLPGLGLNHSLVINAAHQQHGVNNTVSFSNNFPFSRGYTVANLYKLDKIGANYHFPIAYPDAGVANTVYLMRIRGNLFYDYTYGSDFYNNGTRLNATFRTVGGGVFFDTKFFNQQSISFGIRYNRLLDDDLFGGNGRNRIELVLPVSLF